MYTQLQTNPTINNIWCIPYENLRLNTNTNARCIEVFPNIPNDAIVIYSSSDEGITVLGYYALDNLNMTRSENYESFKSATIDMQGQDPTREIRRRHCTRIREWIFDNSLKNEEYLRHICLSIVLDLKSIVWFNNRRGEISFYPVADGFVNMGAISYFVNEFMNE